MITLSQVNQYAMDNNLGDDTDIFSILSLMQLECREDATRRVAKSVTPTPSAPRMDFIDKVEYSTQDVLDLFNT